MKPTLISCAALVMVLVAELHASNSYAAESNNDPSGGTVQLDNTYYHAWALDDGSYILSNDSGFDPGKGPGLSGNKLEKTQ